MKRSSRRERQVRKRILILCEGLTEKNYFQAIKEDPDYKQRLIAVQPEIVAAKNPAPEHVVREAAERRQKALEEGNPYDAVWIIFDHDHHANRRAAFDWARKEQISTGFSTISFEYWCLLHFLQSTKTFPSANELIAELRKHSPGYQKAKQNDFSYLKGKLSSGLKNAAWLRKQRTDTEIHPTDQNPWTDVDILVIELTQENS